MPSLRMTSRHAATVVCLVVVFAACGDDDDDDAAGSALTAATSLSSAPASTSARSPSPTSGTSATTGGSDATPTTGDGEQAVVLVDAGDESEQIELPGTAEVGQRGSGATTIDLRLAMEGTGVSQDVPVSLRMDVDVEVVEATEDGYVAETAITGAEVLDAPPDLDQSSIDALAGVRYRQEFAADGTAGDPEPTNDDQWTDGQRRAFEDFASQLGTTSLAFPSEPIGVAARWDVHRTTENQGFDIDVTYHYELTSIDGDAYTVSVDYDEDIDDDVESGGQTAHMTGRLKGSGTTSGTVGHPIAVKTSVSQQFDVDVDAQGEQVSMALTSNVVVDVTES